jgi:hypothetical protein
MSGQIQDASGASAARTETTERVYENPADITVDAERMAQDGWTLIAQTEREPKQGCMMKFGGFLFRSKAPTQHVVTYRRTVQ